MESWLLFQILMRKVVYKGYFSIYENKAFLIRIHRIVVRDVIPMHLKVFFLKRAILTFSVSSKKSVSRMSFDHRMLFT